MSTTCPLADEGLSFRFQLGCVRVVLRALRDRYDILTLSDYASGGALDHAAELLVERLAS